MEKLKHLLEFLCELIDVQIKKYKLLVMMGVGPDAGMNAVLVLNEYCIFKNPPFSKGEVPPLHVSSHF